VKSQIIERTTILRIDPMSTSLTQCVRFRSGFVYAPLLIVALVSSKGFAQAADGPQKPPENKLPPARAVQGVLEKAWPDQPEWVAMLTDILQGSQLGPTDGWFRKAFAQTRFDWHATRSKYDKDGDGKIARSEFPGSDVDFMRLDRDRDRDLTPADFDFSAHALTASPGLMLFYRTDMDGNGKVTREELDRFFAMLDSDKQGFLSLNDLQQAFTPPPRGRGSSGSSQGPTRWTLLKGLYRQEIGSRQPGPAVGESAPDFTLRTVDGKEEITLAQQIGVKPVVLIFGNFTCGPFRGQAGNVEKLYQRYKDKANFVMVYVREAHPTDGWSMESNSRVGVSLRQPRSYDERVGVAQTCSKTLGLGMPMLVDTMKDEVGARYSGMPSRLYLIDRLGAVTYKSGRGPFGFKPAELEQSLILLLQEGSAPKPAVDQAQAPDAASPCKK
jgi:hypothetical protein